jgi:hypothetical protein
MSTKQEIIDRAMQIATAGADAGDSPVIDSEMTAEDMLPLAVRHTYRSLLVSGQMRYQDVVREHSIVLTANVGTLPEDVLVEYLEHAELPDYPWAAYLRQLSDYQRSRFDELLSYFTAHKGSFYFSGIENPGNGTVKLHAASLPEIGGASVEIVMTEAARDAVINNLALALRGELRFI